MVEPLGSPSLYQARFSSFLINKILKIVEIVNVELWFFAPDFRRDPRDHLSVKVLADPGVDAADSFFHFFAGAGKA